MNFSISTLYILEEQFDTVFGNIFGTAGCRDISQFNAVSLKNVSSEILDELVFELLTLAEKSKNVLRSAAINIEKLRSDQVNSQKKLITVQDELIKNSSPQTQIVKDDIKTEIRSYRDVVQSQAKITPKKIKAVVKSTVEHDERKWSIMVFGLVEDKEESMRGNLDEMLNIIS